MSKILAGKNVIVTGASRGLGSHIARAMWCNGANLLLVARLEGSLHKLCADLVADGYGEQHTHVVAIDLAESDAVSTIMDEARRVWDRVDVLINNAGIQGPIGNAWENDWEQWETTIRVNLLAPVRLCRACTPWMKEQGQGKIINLSGGGATSPRPYFSAYATAKAGLVRFSETLAQEVRDFNIQVNCVAPGAMNTEMLQAVLRVGPEMAGEIEYAHAMKQVESGSASIERAADLFVFLASPASNGITGKLISAAWDPWGSLPERVDELRDSDIYTLRRIVPRDRGKDWG